MTPDVPTEIRLGSALYISNPTADMSDWAQRNLRLDNPEYIRRARMGKWTGNTPRYICLYSTEGPYLVLPYGVMCSLNEEPFRGYPRRSVLKPSVRVDYNGAVPLYDYQERAVAEALKAKYGILQAPAGSGKTQMGIALMMKLGLRTLWLTHTADLLKQSRDRALRYMDKSLVGTITAGKVNIGTGVTFATVQTMVHLDLEKYRDMWDLIIVDECFPAGTPIATERGDIPIEDIRPGDMVYSRNDSTGQVELRRVYETQFRKRHNHIVRITLQDGRKITCTENHPIYANDNGYKRAGEIKHGDEVRVLREDVRYYNMEQENAVGINERETESTLLKEMCDEHGKNAGRVDRRTERDFSHDDEKYEPCLRFSANERTQSDEQFGYESENVGIVTAYRSSSEDSRWKRTWPDGPSTDPLSEVDGAWSSYGVLSGDTYETDGVSDGIQDRHCSAAGNDSNRDRRSISLCTAGAAGRCEEGRFLDVVRVESVEILQPGSDGKYGEVCPDDIVYNFSVEENHNYFANGVLVHNCHRVSGSPSVVTMFSKVLGNLAARHKYGLSATVHRSDGMIRATYALLGPVFYRVPPEDVADKIMRVTVQPVDTRVGMDARCLSSDGMLDYAKLIDYLCTNEMRNQLIVELISVNRGTSGLVLSDRLEHLEEIMSMLAPEDRAQAAMISGKMVSKSARAEREAIIERMRTGELKTLFATYSLAREGLDIPILSRLYMATPQADYAVVTQSIGRIARVHPDKPEPVCYDLVDNMPFLIKRYKKRCVSYRKANCIQR